jgi:hypothetical protein
MDHGERLRGSRQSELSGYITRVVTRFSRLTFKEEPMLKVFGVALLASVIWVGPGAAAPNGAPLKCLAVEVNPVTNHAECVDPIGAPIETQPTCQVKTSSGSWTTSGSWTMSNRCKTRATPPS